MLSLVGLIFKSKYRDWYHGRYLNATGYGRRRLIDIYHVRLYQSKLPGYLLAIWQLSLPAFLPAHPTTIDFRQQIRRTCHITNKQKL
jgi:hypothetical protein